jgi:hypothetical protein
MKVDTDCCGTDAEKGKKTKDMPPMECVTMIRGLESF